MERELTGHWTGQYTYPEGGDATAFKAELHETAGRFTGSISEMDRVEGFLSAVIEGRRTGSVVRFTKFYESGSADFETVIYEGVLNPDGSEIEGAWRMSGWSGRFLMVRSPEHEAEAPWRQTRV